MKPFKLILMTLAAVALLLPNVAFGQAGWALDFDGQNQYAMIPRNDVLNCGNVTIEAWINPRQCIAQDRWDSILNKPFLQHVAPHYQWNLTRDQAGRVAVSFAIDGVSRGAASDGGLVQLNEWYHEAATYDGE